MSTTLLDVTAGAAAGISDGFRVALTAGGPVGLSIRATTGGADLTSYAKPLRLIVGSSNFTDGPTAAADIKAELSGSGVFSIPIEASVTASDVRYTEAAAILSGPVAYGYLVADEALSADLAIEVEALEL